MPLIRPKKRLFQIGFKQIKKFVPKRVKEENVLCNSTSVISFISKTGLHLRFLLLLKLIPHILKIFDMTCLCSFELLRLGYCRSQLLRQLVYTMFIRNNRALFHL